jgi:hypothetical protein
LFNLISKLNLDDKNDENNSIKSDGLSNLIEENKQLNKIILELKLVIAKLYEKVYDKTRV